MREKIKLDLGCGECKKKGFIGIDSSKLKGVDVVCNLEKNFPFKDNSIDEIYSNHTIEHFDNLINVFEEICRVLKTNSIATIIVPHHSNPLTHSFMHKSYWSYYSLNFLEKGRERHYYTKANFKILKKEIHILGGDMFLKPLQWFINIFPNLYEAVLCPLIKATEIMFVLQKN